MKRQSLLISLRYAGFHDDTESFVRLFSENKISYKAAKQAFDGGKKAKLKGVRCNCFSCSEKRN